MDHDTLAGRLARRGFRRWYERQLIDAHLWLVGCLIAMIVVAAGVELASFGSGSAERLYDGALVLGGLVAGVYAFRRYSIALMVAEFIGEQADCPGCGRHGFRVTPQTAEPRREALMPAAQIEPGEMLAFCPRCECSWAVRLPVTGFGAKR